MTALELKTKNYNEATRYIQNAIEILKTKAKKEGNYYQDAKYVRMVAVRHIVGFFWRWKHFCN